MKQTVYFHDFQNAFEKMRPNNFTYEGLQQLFDYLQSYEDDTGEQLELDVIAFCCEYSEMTAEDFASSHGYDDEFDENEKITLDRAFAYLADRTSVIGRTDSTIIFQNF